MLQDEKRKSDEAKKHAKQLTEQLESYKHIDFIVNASAAEVNNKMHQVCDFSKASKEYSIIIGKIDISVSFGRQSI